ncbi:hypothetical protein ABPG77_009200 [Micractinium sp. CCAP 211/92]
MGWASLVGAAVPRPSLLLGCKARSTQRSQPPIRRWSSIASRRTVPPPLAGRGWLPPPADELNGWETGGGFSSSSDEEDEDDLDLFPDEAKGDPEFMVENVLATALLALAAVAAAFVMLKLLIVLYSLVSAAIRYTIVGVLLAVGLVAFQPGRWWF